MTLTDVRVLHAIGGQLVRRGSVVASAPRSYLTLIRDEQFTGGVVPSWLTAYDASNGNATFGSPTRIQRYQAANAVVGSGTAGSTGGTSLKLIVNETDNGSGTLPSTTDAGTRYSYTAAMVDSRTFGWYGPRYGWYSWRCKIPHGQGIWPSMWLVAKNGGSGTVELDVQEYFHSQIPAKNSSTLHGIDNAGVYSPASGKYTNNGAAGNGVGGRTFFEAPTDTPAWHLWEAEIVPVTDATGNTLADPTAPSNYVRITIFLDGVQAWRVVDATALKWSTDGGSADSFWNVFMQGAQVDGNFVGHPRDTLGYSHWKNVCLISGTAPGSCATSTGGYSIKRATFDGVANVTEVDYFRCWQYTG